jgi:phosphoribosylglycinamide formyltransferase-1
MTKQRPAKVAILVGPKGRGSNMAALIAACSDKEYPASVEIVIAPKAESPAVALAESLGAKTAIVGYGDAFDIRLIDALGESEWLCLAGFLRIVPPEVLRRLGGRVLNIHPSLLPKFGGKGMYGHFVHEAVLAAGETESGCTVHYVNEIYDDGAILLQARCPVLPDDTPDTLASRILKLEHETYPAALRKGIDEKLR